MSGLEFSEGGDDETRERQVVGEGLIDKVEAKLEGLKPFGVEAGLILERTRLGSGDAQTTVEHNSDMRLHPASTAKLMTALYVMQKFDGISARQLHDHNGLDWRSWPKAAVIRRGGGFYDRKRAPEHASIAGVLFDMLGSGSGNQAQKALIGYTDEDIAAYNEFCIRMGFATEEYPALKRAGEHGIEFMDRTPSELLRALRHIPTIDSNRADGSLESIVSGALKAHGTKFGTAKRSVVTVDDAGFERPFADDKPYVQSKSGALKPDDTIPTHLRHEAGRFVNTNNGEVINYVIFTSSPPDDTRVPLFVAKRFISGVGADVGKELGFVLHGQSHTERALAHVAGWMYSIRPSRV
jgi:hypothetical protein